MKNKGTLGTAILIVIAIIVLAVIFAWGKTEKKETANDSQNQTTENQTATTETGDAGKLGPNEVVITSKNFEAEVIKAGANKLVVIDAYAPWCPHCQKMGPVITELANEYVGKVKFGKMNADSQDSSQEANFTYAQSIGLDGYPTFFFYKNGKQVAMISGERTRAEFKDEIAKYIK